MRKILSLVAVALLAGCFTLSENEFPQVKMSKLPEGRVVNLQLAGFEAAVTSYATVHGYQTVMNGYYGPGWYGPGFYYGPTTVATTAFVPQVAADQTFINRATDTLERAGFMLRTAAPDYRAEVHFTGPYEADGTAMKNFAWSLFTIFTADRVCRSWKAQLKIYEVKTGKLLEAIDFAQEYQVLVWGPIPFFSPLSSEKVAYNYTQSWALTALTDRATEEICKFLIPQSK